jgi:phosphate starvation-inducible protein PhoH
MKKSEQELLDLKEKLEENKQKVNRLAGQLDNYISVLKEEYGCKSVKEAKEKLRTLQDQQQQIDDQIEEKTQELTEKYPEL